MSATIVFGDGQTLAVPASDARELLETLSRVGFGAPTPTGPLPPGWASVETENGFVYVNPSQVAYVSDGDEYFEVRFGDLERRRIAPDT